MNEDMNLLDAEDISPKQFPYAKVAKASFVIAVTSPLLIIITFILAPIVSFGRTGEPTLPPLLFVVAGLGMLAMLACPVGIALGIVGVLHKNPKRSYAIIGLIINSCFLLGIIGLFVLGRSFAP